MEEWKRIYHLERDTGCYVSNFGRVKSKKGFLLQSNNGGGYLTVHLFSFIDEQGERRWVRKYVHRLVAEYFLDNPEDLPQVNHKDSDKSNNSVSNLEWISKADNIKHSHENGNMQKRYDVGAVIVLTKDQVIECYTRVKAGEGINKVAASMGKPRTTISSIINKRSRKDITDLLD